MSFDSACHLDTIDILAQTILYLESVGYAQAQIYDQDGVLRH